ncbi:uncharacterized protein LOC124131011 [Haliotis rufescens]|uniref:uncharacterized protein LOC124131011 n=1 Tax=Haliotis rufescens TaxID=6454 RepID=UPI00201F20C7|nr:uncharacterized protein LOC124131011 [Haliotis rufescens]
MSYKVNAVVGLCVLMTPCIAFIVPQPTALDLMKLLGPQAPFGQPASVGQGLGSNVFGQKSNCLFRGCINGKCIPVYGFTGNYVCQCPPGHSLHPTDKLMCVPTDASTFGRRQSLFRILSLLQWLRSMQSMRQPSPTQGQPQNEALFDA